MKKVLVTGGAGFIGSHVTGELMKLGYDVTVLDDLSGGFKENVNDSAHFVEGSIENPGLIEKLFREKKFEIVYHLAAYAAEGLSHFIRRYNYQNNLVGSVNILNEAVKNGVKRIVFTSSIAVYGSSQLPMREDMTPQPEDPYGIAKRAFELDLRAAAKMFGIEYVIFRPHNVYGERQNIGDPYRNVIGIFMNKIMKKEKLPIFGDGKQTRAFTYIGDVAPVIAVSGLMDECRNDIFNIGADTPVSVLELAELVCKKMGVKPDLEYLPARYEVTHAFSDHEKSNRVFGIKDNVSLETGIQKMAEWALKSGPALPKPFSNIEVRYNLPSNWEKIISK